MDKLVFDTSFLNEPPADEWDILIEDLEPVIFTRATSLGPFEYTFGINHSSNMSLLVGTAVCIPTISYNIVPGKISFRKKNTKKKSNIHKITEINFVKIAETKNIVSILEYRVIQKYKNGIIKIN